VGLARRPVAHTIEVFGEGPDGRPLLVLVAGEADRVALPPFEGEIDISLWWLPPSHTHPPPGGEQEP
jgi:hypothetical protein